MYALLSNSLARPAINFLQPRTRFICHLCTLLEIPEYILCLRNGFEEVRVHAAFLRQKVVGIRVNDPPSWPLLAAEGEFMEPLPPILSHHLMFWRCVASKCASRK